MRTFELLFLLSVLLGSSVTAQSNGTTDTPIPSTPAPTTLSAELDVAFTIFCDSLVSAYVADIAAVAGVLPRRLQPVSYGNAIALEFGKTYIFTLKVSEPTGVGGDSMEALDVAQRVEQRVTAALAAGSKMLQRRTILSVRRVTPEPRATELGSVGVNYVWVAFLLLGFVMVIASLFVLFRRRSAAADENVAIDGNEDIRPAPQDIINDNVTAVQKLVGQATEAREQQRREREREMRHRPKHALFAAALEYDHRLRLPPPATFDPLSKDNWQPPPINRSGPAQPAIRLEAPDERSASEQATARSSVRPPTEDGTHLTAGSSAVPSALMTPAPVERPSPPAPSFGAPRRSHQPFDEDEL